MKKRILSFMLALCLIIPAIMFIGCKKQQDEFTPKYSAEITGVEFRAILQDYYVKSNPNVAGEFDIVLDFSARNTEDFEQTLNYNLFAIEVSNVEDSNIAVIGPMYNEDDLTLKQGEIVSYTMKVLLFNTSREEIGERVFICKYNGEIFAEFKIDGNKI